VHDSGSWWKYQEAVAAFGLRPRYTRADVETAFRRFALNVHPDAGGTHEAFQDLLAQRDLLLSHASDLTYVDPTRIK
jgi:curved DNA-binding protein CbpA